MAKKVASEEILDEKVKKAVEAAAEVVIQVFEKPLDYIIKNETLTTVKPPVEENKINENE